MADDFLYGTKAIAEYMGLYHLTVSRWIRERGLPATFQGIGYITTKQAIDGWLDTHLEADVAWFKKRQ